MRISIVDFLLLATIVGLSLASPAANAGTPVDCLHPSYSWRSADAPRSKLIPEIAQPIPLEATVHLRPLGESMSSNLMKYSGILRQIVSCLGSAALLAVLLGCSDDSQGAETAARFECCPSPAPAFANGLRAHVGHLIRWVSFAGRISAHSDA